jgi:MFS family permease
MYLIGVGLVGAIISAIVTDKWHRYNEMVKVIFTLAVGATIFFSIVARPGQTGAVAVSLALFGLSGFGILPAALELAVELTYPVSEGTSAGFMWMSGQIFGIILTFVCGAMKNPVVRRFLTLHSTFLSPCSWRRYLLVFQTKDMTNALWLLTASGVLMAVLSFFQYGDYKRLKHDKQLKQGKKPKEDA